jgi:hypothetical protein
MDEDHGERDRVSQVLGQQPIDRAPDDAFADAAALAGDVGREAADLAPDFAPGSGALRSVPTRCRPSP